MAIDRNTIDRAAGEHIRLLRRLGTTTHRQERDIRKLHERAAQRAAASRGRK